ncbi:MAG: DUF4342 domain-containing protein [Melioribacteraceae bacterium]
MSLNKTFNEVLNTIEDLLKQGNVRRIIIKDSNGKLFMEFPIIVGIIGTLAAPIVSSIGLIAGVLSDFSIEIIKRDRKQYAEIIEVKVDK